MSIAIALQIQERYAVVVGGGQVALRKVKQYLQEGAIVCVIAKKFHEELLVNNVIERIESAFDWSLIHEETFLIYAATDDEQLNHRIVKEARHRHILCGSAHHDDACDFISMAQSQREHLQFAISTKGKCPGADKTFLEELAKPLHVMNQKTAILNRIRTLLPVKSSTILTDLTKLSVDNLQLIEESYQHHKSILLLAYHGIANIKEAQSSMKQMQDKVMNSYPNQIVMDAFLSAKIVGKAKQKGFVVDEVKMIVASLQALHIPFIVQPMLLHFGYWYDQLKQLDVTLGDCLLSNKHDEQQLYDVLKGAYPDGQLLAIYHNQEGELFTSLKKNSTDQCVSLSNMIDNDDSNLHIIPLFVLLGHHAKYDIQAHISSACAYHKKGLLAYGQVQDMFLVKIHLLMDNN